MDLDGINRFCDSYDVDWLVNTSPALSMMGIADTMRERGVKVFGADRVLAGYEDNQSQFELWLADNDFRTEPVSYDGEVAIASRRMVSIDYLFHEQQASIYRTSDFLFDKRCADRWTSQLSPSHCDAAIRLKVKPLLDKLVLGTQGPGVGVINAMIDYNGELFFLESLARPRNREVPIDSISITRLLENCQGGSVHLTDVSTGKARAIIRLFPSRAIEFDIEYINNLNAHIPLLDLSFSSEKLIYNPSPEGMQVVVVGNDVGEAQKLCKESVELLSDRYEL